VVVRWSGAKSADVYLAERSDTEREHARLVSAANHDGAFQIALTSERRPYILLRDRRDGSVIRVAERALPLEQGSNFRDIGGYPATGGKHVRWGLIYRSAATPVLSAHDIAAIQALGIRESVDLRSTEERALAPSVLENHGVRFMTIAYPFKDLPQTYPEILTKLVPQYRMLFEDLLSRSTPLSFNCTAGQDRSGVAAALILSALGVPRQVIIADYDLSTRYRRPQYEVPASDLTNGSDNPAAALLTEVRYSTPSPLYTDTGRSMLAELLDQIDTRWGSVDNYLTQSLGVGPPQRARLRALYLE